MTPCNKLVMSIQGWPLTPCCSVVGYIEVSNQFLLSCSGPPFITYLNELPPLTREDAGPFRMPISDKYKVCVCV